MLVKVASRLLFLLFVLSISAVAQVQSLITAPVDPSQRIAIPNSRHPLARAAFDVGPVPDGLPMDRMLLVLGPGAAQERQLRTFLDSQQDSGSSNYHQWLTPAEFGQMFGPSPSDIRQVAGWLRQQGFTVNSIAGSGRWIEFSGSAAQVQAAFQTQMRQYQIAGETHIANAAEVSIPTALAPVVRGLLSLHDFRKKPMISRYSNVHRNEHGELIPTDPNFTFNSNGTLFHYLSPADYAKIYDLASLYQSGANGAGQTIALVGRSKVTLTDSQLFRQTFSLPANDPKMIVTGTDPGFTFDGDAVEATLDVQWAGAVAPGATIDLVVSASTVTTDGVDLAAAYIVDNNLAPIMSVSFGECEKLLGATENAFYNALWQQAAAQGISVFVAAGDNGAAGCDDPNDPLSIPARGGPAVSGLASTPFNTAVGGTQFNENGNDSAFWNTSNGTGFGSVKGYIPEAVWNESCDPTVPNSPCVTLFFNLFAGSGGASSLYSKPSWQSLSIQGMPNDGMRDLPDISLTAAGGHDGYLFCLFGSCQVSTDPNGNPILIDASVVGGTSASSPSFAGIMAIINQKTGSRQGLANYILYALAAKANFATCNSSLRADPTASTTCIFNDTTAGNNNVPGQTGFSGVTGYDLATGLGSVDAANLVNAWVTQAAGFQGSATTLAANGATTVQHGQPVSFTVSVKPISGNAVPGGNVALVTDKTGATGPGSVVTIGAGVLSSGSFTGSFSSLPGGQYNVIAHYPGDGTFGGSDSNAVAVNVSKENSTTTLSTFTTDIHGNAVPGTSGAYGDFLDIHTLAAGVSKQGFASGTMVLTDNGSQIASLPLNSQGQADLLSFGFGAPVTLTVGTHNLSASYSGDSSFNASSTAQPVTVTINKATPLIFLNASSFSVNVGQPVTVAAFLFNTGPIEPSGTVQFFDGATAIGSPVTLAFSSFTGLEQAGLQVTFSTTGTHNISVSYSGDSTYNSVKSSFSVPISVGNSNQTSLFTLAALPGTTSVTIQAGQTATYNLSLVPSTSFTGSVSFTCTGAPGGASCTVSPNPANVTSSTATVPVTVTISNTQNAGAINPASMTGLPLNGLPVVLTAVLAGALFGMRKNRRPALLLGIAALLIAGMSACGGGGSTPPPPTSHAPTNATLTVTATSGNQSATINLTLIVNH